MPIYITQILCLAIYCYNLCTIIGDNPHLKRTIYFLLHIKGDFKYRAISKFFKQRQCYFLLHAILRKNYILYLDLKDIAKNYAYH